MADEAIVTATAADLSHLDAGGIVDVEHEAVVIAEATAEAGGAIDAVLSAKLGSSVWMIDFGAIDPSGSSAGAAMEFVVA